MPFEITAGFSQKLKHAPFRISVTAENLQKLNLLYEKPSQNQILSINQTTKERKKIWDYGESALRHIIIGLDIIPT
jgi:hypothetical protein